jgi:hypothetical protein
MAHCCAYACSPSEAQPMHTCMPSSADMPPPDMSASSTTPTLSMSPGTSFGCMLSSATNCSLTKSSPTARQSLSERCAMYSRMKMRNFSGTSVTRPAP